MDIFQQNDEFIDFDRPVPFTLCRESLIVEVINLLNSKVSVHLMGPSQCGKTNMIENIIYPYLNNESNIEPIDKAYIGHPSPYIRRPKFDFSYIQTKPNKRSIMDAIEEFERKSGKRADLGTGPTFRVIAGRWCDLLREYIREKKLMAYYVVMNDFDLNQDTLDFVTALQDVVQFVIAFKHEPPAEFWHYSIAKRGKNVKFEPLSNEEARTLTMVLMEKEKVYCNKDVYDGFLQLNESHTVVVPGEIVRRVRTLKKEMMEYRSQHIPFHYKHLKDVFPFALHYVEVKSTVIIHMTVFIIGCILMYPILNPNRTRDFQKILSGGGVVVLSIWGINLWDRRSKQPRQYMRTR